MKIMLKLKFTSLSILWLFAMLMPMGALKAATLAERLSGRILLQVEAHGEAWYVYPDTMQRYYLGSPSDAYEAMQAFGLGISNADFYRFNSKAPQKLAGKILLKVHDKGQAYYVDPVTLKMHYLGNADAAYKVMRELGLGISNANLNKIAISANGAIRPYYYREITVNDSGASIESLSVDRGSKVDLVIHVEEKGVARAGIEFKGTGGMSGIGMIVAGESKTVTFRPYRSFSYIPFLADTTIRLPYEIAVHVN